MAKLKILAIILALLMLQGCAAHYSATELQGWVVDADTKKPLEGVNVVAHWVLEWGDWSSYRTDMELMESVTDKEGRFYFPAWGPKSKPSGVPLRAVMGNMDPGLILFKSGYFFNGASGGDYDPKKIIDGGKSVRSSLLNGQTIELKKFVGDKSSYALNVDLTLTGVSIGGCNWKKIPRMIVALNDEAKEIKKYDPWFSTLVSYNHLLANEKINGCGSVKEFFKAYTDESSIK